VNKLIYGYGVTGKAVEAFFNKKNIPYKIFDENSNENYGNKIVKDELLKENFDEVILSPGIQDNNDILNILRKKNLSVITDIDLFDKYHKQKSKIIGVTGTNGKTTFVNLLNDFLDLEGFKTSACGNIGESPLNIVDGDYDYIIIELSSYQLFHTKSVRLDYAILLNIASDHLDWHGSLEGYIEAKSKIFNFVDKEKVIFYDNTFSNNNSRKPHISKNNLEEYNLHEINLPAELSRSFLDMINFLDFDRENTVKRGYEYLKRINPIEHRFENISFNDEVIYINDSKATNFHAVSSAISRVENAILILHGLTKNMPSSELKLSENIKKIIKPKDMKLEIKNYGGVLIEIDSIYDLKNVLLKEIEKGDTVLFSCGGSSFNDFNNYEDRGQYFKKIVDDFKNEN
jgi:UDP-N-acetylmuramoylalanine--D-glutamate ligase